jgi:hypothetical protein
MSCIPLTYDVLFWIINPSSDHRLFRTITLLLNTEIRKQYWWPEDDFIARNMSYAKWIHNIKWNCSVQTDNDDDDDGNDDDDKNNNFNNTTLKHNPMRNTVSFQVGT